MALTAVFNMFAKSPIRPLQSHMKKAHACAMQLLPFFKAVVDTDWTAAEKLQLEIAALETEADVLKRDLRLHLPNNLFLPISRSDVLAMLEAQERIANQAEDIAGLVVGRKMQMPQSMVEDYHAFLQRTLDASHQAWKAISELDELLETGFRGNEVTIVSDMIVKLDQIERDCDNKEANVRSHLFKLESDLPPIDVIFLYQMIEWTGSLADYAQQVGGQLQLLLAK